MRSNPATRTLLSTLNAGLVVGLIVGLAGTAFARGGGSRPDLAVAIDAPSGVYVGDDARYYVTVDNLGNGNADNVELVIDLPATNTSPQVFVLGELGDVDGRCALSAQSLVCDLGRIRRGRSESVYFDVAFPQSAAPLVIDASASTTSNERSSDLGNNSDTHTVALEYYAQPLAGRYGVVNRHCTGMGLVSFLECLYFPSSISSHELIYEANGTLTFPSFYPPGYTGTWSQSSPDHLEVDYFFGTTHVLDFEGDGVGGGCFEGLSLFPSNTYGFVAPYEICLRSI